MSTEAPAEFYLFCLQLLLMEEGRPRVWQRIRSDLLRGGRTTHWLESKACTTARSSATGPRIWLMVTNVLTYTDGDVRHVDRGTDLPGCRDARPAKRALMAELDRRLHELRTALLAHTGMTPAAARIYTAICRNDWRLSGNGLVAAAEAAKAAATDADPPRAGFGDDRAPETDVTRARPIVLRPAGWALAALPG